jgi:hypothetical protein
MMSFSRLPKPEQTQKNHMASDCRNLPRVRSGKAASLVTMEQVREKPLMECARKWKRYSREIS